MEQHYPFTLPPLPYAYDALAPELIERVLYFHHDKHFAAYVDTLNQLLERAPTYQSWPLWRLCLDWRELPDDLRQECEAVFVRQQQIEVLQLAHRIKIGQAGQHSLFLPRGNGRRAQCIP